MSQANSVPTSEARADRLAKRSRRSRRSAVVAVAFLALVVGVSEWLTPAETSSNDAGSGGIAVSRSQAVVDPEETRPRGSALLEHRSQGEEQTRLSPSPTSEGAVHLSQT